MKNVLFAAGLVLLFIMPFASADLIAPGFKSIPVTNKIANINNYPDYVFISTGSLGNKDIAYQMCPVEIIGEDGLIPGYYKFCGVSVYAVKKSDFNSSFFMNSRSFDESQGEAYENSVKEFLASEKAIKVLDKVVVHKEVSVASTQKEINYRHTISLNPIKKPISEKNIVRNNLFYVYIAAPIVALIAIILIVLKRKK
jgi:hypothetical protein